MLILLLSNKRLPNILVAPKNSCLPVEGYNSAAIIWNHHAAWC